MEFHAYKQTGLYHLTRNLPCQDSVYAGRWNRFGMAVVSDGVTACSHGDLGSKLACEAFQEFIQLEGGRIFDYKKEKTAYLLIEHILYFFEKKGLSLARNNNFQSERISLENFACTLSAVCLDCVTGNALIIHLGDGEIYDLFPGRNNLLLPPVKHFGHPCFVTTQNSYQLMCRKQMTMKKGESIFLCTDGMLEHLSMDNRNTEKICLEAVHPDYRYLDQKMKSLKWQDDAGYAMITR